MTNFSLVSKLWINSDGIFLFFQPLTPIVSSSLVSIDVSRLFRGIETLFPIIIDSLYNGVRVVSPQAPINQLLNSAYNQLELQLPFSIPEIEIEQQIVVTSDCHSTTNDIPGTDFQSLLPQEPLQEHHNSQDILQELPNSEETISNFQF